MKKVFLIACFIFYLNLASSAQAFKPELNVAHKLETFLSSRLIEKAYLQLDKPYYAAGDTIYFKAYITAGELHRLSLLSGVLHVDLINTENKIDQSIKLQINGGVCWGDFALPDTLLSGNYRIRAYTQWMRNGESDFFDRNIIIGASQSKDVPKKTANALLQAVNNKADVQFFPEGGKLVTGIRTKIAFKSIGQNGLGLNLKGIILNGTKRADTFASTHLGMGYFYLTSAEGESYKANIIFADGTQNIVDLPKPEASGVSLTVNNSIQKVEITIESNKAYYKINQNKNFLVVIYSGGKLITVPFKLEDAINYLKLDKKQFRTSIAYITLFSPEGEPICERLLFVQNHDQLNLSIQADKAVYSKREKVSLLLNEKNLADSIVAGHFLYQ